MNCPKCNSIVENKASFFWLGLLGRIAFPKYVCPTCGKVEFKYFSKDVRRQIIAQRALCGVLLSMIFIYFILT